MYLEPSPPQTRPVPSAVRQWVADMTALCQPAQVCWCAGTADEHARLLADAVRQGLLLPLDPEQLPYCHIRRSAPHHAVPPEPVVCTPAATATSRWLAPQAAYAQLTAWFRGAMRGRTLYVVTFVLGPLGSSQARVGVQLTDSLYAVLRLAATARVGPLAWDLPAAAECTRCLHSVGDGHPEHRLICHFPQDNALWSFGADCDLLLSSPPPAARPAPARSAGARLAAETRPAEAPDLEHVLDSILDEYCTRRRFDTDA